MHSLNFSSLGFSVIRYHDHNHHHLLLHQYSQLDSYNNFRWYLLSFCYLLGTIFSILLSALLIQVLSVLFCVLLRVLEF